MRKVKPIPWNKGLKGVQRNPYKGKKLPWKVPKSPAVRKKISKKLMGHKAFGGFETRFNKYWMNVLRNRIRS